MKNVFEEMVHYLAKALACFVFIGFWKSCSGQAGAKVFRSDSSGLLPLSTLKFYDFFTKSELTYFADSYRPRVHIGR